ncbi:hypothetical protein ABW19_dt0204325 [Dactylella cylindrospora]|nr:hypothetical protein ABW19_dt0204325 [Dactylella cylindrospora]
MEVLPPPYNPTTSPTTASPYDQDQIATPTVHTYATQLPAFNTPRKYSSRLRRLLQQRSSSRGVYLTLHIPGQSNHCRLISIESASTTSPSNSETSESSDAISEKNVYISNEKTPLLAGLSAGIPLVEDLEAGTLNIQPTHPPRTSSRHANKKSVRRLRCRRDPRYRYTNPADRETSWLTFFALLLLIFTVVCAAGVFIAWATGFTSGRLAALKIHGSAGPGITGVGRVYGSETTASSSADGVVYTNGEVAKVPSASAGAGGFNQHDDTWSQKEGDMDMSVKGRMKRSRVYRGKRDAEAEAVESESVGFPTAAERSEEGILEDVVFR